MSHSRYRRVARPGTAWWAAFRKNTSPQKLSQVNTMKPPSRLEPNTV